MGQNRKFWPGEGISLWNFTPAVHMRKDSPQDFVPLLAAPQPKIPIWLLTVVRPNGAFDQCATKTWVRSFWGATMVQISKIFSWRAFRPLRNGPESFPPRFFTHFGGLTAKNYESVFLTGMRPNGAFDRRATKSWVWSFWPSCDYFPLLVLLTNGATNGAVNLNHIQNRKIPFKEKKITILFLLYFIRINVSRRLMEECQKQF